MDRRSTSNTNGEVEMSLPQILINNRSDISVLQTGQQAIPYTVDNWNRYFADDIAFNNLSRKYPIQITRGDIFTMGNNLRTHYSWNGLREFFISIMLWGFGITNYGAYRTDIMVRDTNFQNTIESSYRSIDNGNVLQAYNAFSLDMCGSAFFTKFFYFVGKGSRNLPMPLILDSVVARSLEERCGLNISRYAKVSRHPDNPRNAGRGRVGKISAVNCYGWGYMNYLNDMDAWARHLEVVPDQIELFLFS